MVPHKNGSLRKNTQRLFVKGQSQAIFKKKFLNLLYDSDAWLWDFKVKFFPLQIDILMCLIVEVGSICRMSVYFRKSIMQLRDAIYNSCHFLQGGIFAKMSALFGCLICQVDLAILTKHLCQIFQVTLHGYLIFCNLQNTNLQKIPRKKTIRRICLKIQFSAIFT